MDLISKPISPTPRANERSLQTEPDHKDVACLPGKCNDRPLRVMVFLEANTIAGAVKPVLEFAREAAVSTVRTGIKLTMVSYVREQHGSSLIGLLKAEGIPIEVVTERQAFDLRIISQLRDLASRLHPDIIWTNNTKSHFLARLSGLDRRAEWIAFHHGYTKEAWRTRIYNEFDRCSLPHAKRVVTVCHDFARQLQRKGVPASRIRVLRNPIRVSSAISEAERTQLRTELGWNDAKVLLSVGRLRSRRVMRTFSGPSRP